MGALAEAEARVNRSLVAGASKRAVAAEETQNALLAEVSRTRFALSKVEADRDEWRREALVARVPAIVESIIDNDADGFLNGLLRADQADLFEGNGLLNARRTFLSSTQSTSVFYNTTLTDRRRPNRK
jgi:hypothetical protein